MIKLMIHYTMTDYCTITYKYSYEALVIGKCFDDILEFLFDFIHVTFVPGLEFQIVRTELFNDYNNTGVINNNLIYCKKLPGKETLNVQKRRAN